MPMSVKIMPKPRNAGARPAGPLVAVLAYDGLCTFEFGVAVEIFALPRPELGADWYRFAICGIEPGPLRAAGGLTVSVQGGLALLRRADIVIVPGWRGIAEPVPPKLIASLAAAHRRGARIVSFCSGIAVLAAAGLLDGKRATTHWRYVAAVAERYPGIRLEPGVLYVDEGRIMTAAGSAAGIDLCLHMIRKDHGAAAANSVARRLVVPPHRDGGQAQFIVAPVPAERESGRLSPILDWIRDHLDETPTIARLAKRAGMSARTFQRRFEAATGVAPGQWIVNEKLRAARDMLEKSRTATLDDVAAACGFGAPATMRHHFRARLGTSPAAYRERFNPRHAEKFQRQYLRTQG